MYRTINTEYIKGGITMTINKETETKIITAAYELVAEGNENPTNAQVRERLGGGSLSHISPVMRKWREEQSKQSTQLKSIPEALENSIRIAISQVWGTAQSIANEATELVKTEAEAQALEISNERDEALQELEKVELELQSAKKELELALKHSKENKELLAKALQDYEVQGRILKDRENQIVKLNETTNKLQNEILEIAKKNR